MITKEFCKQQLSRLSQKRNRPQTQEAISELISALQDSCRSELECHEVISDCLDYEFHPEPYELRRLAWQKRQPEWSQSGSGGCEACGGVGYVSLRIGGCDYAKPCVCRQQAGVCEEVVNG